MKTDAKPATRNALVVEDSLPFARLVETALTGVGAQWQVRHMSNGTDAIAYLASKNARANLVLVDLGLPDMSGVEVIRAARERFPDVPIMVISVLTSSANVLAAIQAGARGYLHKGDSALTLSQALTKVLAGEYPISPSLAYYLFKLAQEQAPSAGTPAPITVSPRELELLQLLGDGHTYEEAANKMAISVHTAETFSRRIYQKLQVGTKREALAAARGRGWL